MKSDSLMSWNRSKAKAIEYIKIDMESTERESRMGQKDEKWRQHTNVTSRYGYV